MAQVAEKQWQAQETGITAAASPFAKPERPPVLSLSLANVSKLNSNRSGNSSLADDLCSMWSVFSKCKGALQDGERLENLSWRLWSREGSFFRQEEEELSFGSASEADIDPSSGAMKVPNGETQQPLSDPEGSDWESDSSAGTSQGKETSQAAPYEESRQGQPLPMARPALQLPAHQSHSSSSAPTRSPVRRSPSFQKQKKNRSDSFHHSSKHRGLTPVELQALFSTILPMRLPNPPHSAAAAASTSSASAVKPQNARPEPTHKPALSNQSAQAAQAQAGVSPKRDFSNSSIDSHLSAEAMVPRISPQSDTSCDSLNAAAQDKTPRAPLRSLPSEASEKSGEHSLASVQEHLPKASSSSTSQERVTLETSAWQGSQPSETELSESLSASGSKPGALKRNASLSAAMTHQRHPHHPRVQAKAGGALGHKKPNIHRRGNSAKLILSRNSSAKNVRIVEGAVDEAPAPSPDGSRALKRSNSGGRSQGGERMHRASSSGSSTSNLSRFSRQGSALSLDKQAHNSNAAQPAPIPQPVAGTATGNRSSSVSSATPASLEPKSVQRGFEPASPLPPPMPRAPASSPAVGPPPIYPIASGPKAPPSQPTASTFNHQASDQAVLSTSPPAGQQLDAAVTSQPALQTASAGFDGPKPTAAPALSAAETASTRKTSALTATAAAPTNGSTTVNSNGANAANKRKFFLGAQSASDSDEMAKSPDHASAFSHHLPNNFHPHDHHHHHPGHTHRPMSGSLHTPTAPSSLKNESYFPDTSAASKHEEVANEADADDSSGWGSDYTEDSDEEKGRSLGNGGLDAKGKGKAKASNAAPQEDMFLKRVPTAPGQLNRTESRTGLLTQLFKPSVDDLHVVDEARRRQARASAGLTRNFSAVGLVNHPSQEHREPLHQQPSAASSRRVLQPSKSSVALPVMSFEAGNKFPEERQQRRHAAAKKASTTESHRSPSPAPARGPAAPPVQPRRPSTGHRLGGRPENVDFSDDSDDSDEASGAPEQQQQDQDVAFTPMKQAALAAAVARHQASNQRGGAAPEPIPQTPRTTRRNMLSTEMSESLRRNLLWERQSRQRLMGMPPSAQQQRTADMTPPDNSNANSRLPGVRSESPKMTRFSGGLHEHGW